MVDTIEAVAASPADDNVASAIGIAVSFFDATAALKGPRSPNHDHICFREGKDTRVGQK